MHLRDDQWKGFEHRHGEYLTHGPDKNGNTALHQAASGGYEHVAQDLIKQGYDINARNMYCESVMQAAVAPLREPANDPRAIQQRLIDAGVDLWGRDNAGNTLLHVAAYAGDAAMCKFLAEGDGLDVNARTSDGKTPLHSAASMGKGEAIDQLLKNGANPAITNSDHKTARDIAVGEQAKVALDNHAFEQRMKSVLLPGAQSALSRLAARLPAQEVSAKGRKL